MVRSLNFFILFMFTLMHFSRGFCNKYTCKTPDQVFLPDTCIYNDNLTDTYYARKCSDSKYQCFSDQKSSYQFNYTCSLPTPQTISNSPGEFCKTSNDCEYQFPCEDGICKGTAKGGQCQNSAECEPGNYCSNSICVPQIKIGESGCQMDYDCVNNAACNQTSYTDLTKNFCYKYRSFKVHDPVAQCYSGKSMLCPYSVCWERFSDRVFYCTNLFTTTKGQGAECDVNEDDGSCDSNSDNFYNPPYITGGKCQCSLNSQGTAHCSPLPGDPVSLQFNTWWTKWVEGEDIFKCNTFARTDINCVKTYWSTKDYNAYNYYYTQVSMFNAIIGAEDCVLETIAENYLEIKNAYDGHGNNDDDGGDSDSDGNDSGAFALCMSVFIAAAVY